MSDYDLVTKAPLKLKSPSAIKKKKKKDKDLKKALEHVNVTSSEGQQKQPVVKEIHRTNAEKAFLKMQEKRQIERIMEKASKTHKQRVEEFNRHLDSLTEHYDIPKVSWTK
ncbi:protein FAM32A-like isoform X2 [Dermacentor variabilis]|uniref:protein FAM32A-like isoform X2 n=1 Tax=Dermacentor variabilis TaxID=34621 RepID=UPI003F5C259E